MSNNPVPDWRCGNMCLQKRGVIASSAQRKPGASITATAKAEVDYLLARVARVDRRANLQPQSSAAG